MKVSFKKILLNLYYWPMLLVVTIIAMIITPCLLIGNAVYPRIPLDRLARLSIRIYGWFLVRVVPFMAPVTVEDKSGGITTPVIFIPNHSSSVDPYLFGMLPFDNAFATSWPFKIPLYNYFMRLAGYINSTLGWEHVQQQGLALIESGCSLIIWPEGHRSRDGKLGRFKTGAFRLALKTGTPLVPVCVIGSRQMLPPGQRFLTPARIKLILLPAIIPDSRGDTPDDTKTLKNKTRAAIAAELKNHSAKTTT